MLINDGNDPIKIMMTDDSRDSQDNDDDKDVEDENGDDGDMNFYDCS